MIFLITGIVNTYCQSYDQLISGTKHTLHSDILNEDRAYWISLPESYDDEGAGYKRYPLLVLLDGDIHFSALTGMVHYMSADRYRSWKFPEMIIVGIQNVDRRRDYTPDKVITVRENTTGGGDDFLRFLEEELIPELDRKYRTVPYRILFGHSLGGLLTAHAYMKEGTLFKAFLAIDPSFGTWDAGIMDAKLDSVTGNSFERFLYIATANWGKRNIRNRDRHVRFFEALNSKCDGELPGQLDYFPDEDHNSVPPIACYHGLSAIFKGYKMSYRDVKSPDQLIHHFQEISRRLSFDFSPPEHLVNQVGYKFLRSENEGEQSMALAFFILNTELYPGSYNAFDSLGEAYDVLGDHPNALESYRRSLKLNPGNENARVRMKKLGGPFPKKIKN